MGGGCSDRHFVLGGATDRQTDKLYGVFIVLIVTTEQEQEIKLLRYISTGECEILLALKACYVFLTFILVPASGNKN